MKLKFYTGSFTQQWAFHIIPSIQLYFESRSPLNRGPLYKTGVSGLYLSGLWGKWQVIVGIFKKI